MLDTRNQSERQTALQEKQQTEDSVEHSKQFLRDSTEYNRQLRREDSMAKLRDSMTEVQLRMMNTQNDVIYRKEKFDQLTYKSDTYVNRPFFDIHLDSTFNDTVNKTSTALLELLNYGERDSHNLKLDAYIISLGDSTYFNYKSSKIGLFPKRESFDISFSLSFQTLPFLFRFGYPTYIYLYLVFEDPALQQRQEQEIVYSLDQTGDLINIPVNEVQTVKKVFKYGHPLRFWIRDRDSTGFSNPKG